MLTGLTVVLAWVNLRGIRQSAWVVNALTIGKLVPLAIVILAGVFFFAPDRLSAVQPVTVAQASTAALLLIFVFGGYDVVPVPAGEAQDPRRHVPFALVMTILVVTVIFTAGQAVCVSLLPDLAATNTPLADASTLMLGAFGGLLISAGSVVAMTGNNMGQVLSGSRMLFALAENGELPRWFGRIHPVFRTPSNAVVFTSLVALVLMLSGSFVALAAVSAVSRLVAYTGACAATLALRRPRFEGEVKPATFVTPLGSVVPVLAILISLGILAGATREQLLGGGAALAVGALLFLTNRNAENRM
jgi:amino acid transporter